MGIKTSKISFNVTQRGRAHRGVNRNFDLRSICAIVNAPATQERVKNRDMVGYYGHWQRAKFGLTPPEMVMIDGELVGLEPAIVTTYLHADADGNIEHESEFLDTASGKIAASMFGSRTGGFSSAIHADTRGNMDVATLFAGFDYVLEPNFTGNRGYILDGVTGDDSTIFDCIMRDMNQGNAAMVTLYDSLRSDHALALQTLQRVMEENEEMLSMLTIGKSVLDSAREAQRPTMVLRAPTDTFARNASMFKSASLASLERLPDAPDPTSDMVLDQVSNHYGVPR